MRAIRPDGGKWLPTPKRRSQTRTSSALGWPDNPARIAALFAMFFVVRCGYALYQTRDWT